MKLILFIVLASVLLFCFGCGQTPSGGSSTAANSGNNANTEGTAAKTPADGMYPSKGVVTKINNELGSIEIDHENIPDLMPAMKMEFFVKDKAMLEPIAVGDNVTFTIEYKQGTEIIIAIGK